MLSSRFYRITLEAAGVNRKEAHTQEGRRAILGGLLGQVAWRASTQKHGTPAWVPVHSHTHAHMQQMVMPERLWGSTHDDPSH